MVNFETLSVGIIMIVGGLVLWAVSVQKGFGWGLLGMLIFAFLFILGSIISVVGLIQQGTKRHVYNLHEPDQIHLNSHSTHRHSSQSITMHCPECGQKVKAHSKYCIHCGTQI